MSRALRIALVLAGALAFGFVLTWTFLAYQSPDRVIDFATFLQMCGFPVAR